MIKCVYKQCKEEALSLSKYCWRHTDDKKSFLDSLSEHIRKTGSINGFYLRRIEFPRAPWQNIDAEDVDLAGADLSNADLTAANLKKANLTGAKLTGAVLTGADLERTHLLKADLSKTVLLHAILKDTNLAEANLEGADLMRAFFSNVKLWHARLYDAKYLTRHNFQGKRPIDESGPLAASEAYRIVKQYFISNGRYDDASWASFKEKQMQRKDLLRNKRLSFFPSLLMSILCGYGEKPNRIVVSSFSIILLYSAVYYWLEVLRTSQDLGGRAFVIWDYLYFSVVTFTTVGFGDLTTKLTPLFQMLVASEAFTGVFMMGLFVFTLSRRYSAR